MPATLLIVPGLRDHVPDHWQTLLALKLSATRPVRTVPALGRANLDCEQRVTAIQQTLDSIRGPIIAVAHSGGVISLAHWAQQHHRADLTGALLAAPADLELPLPAGYPSRQDLADNGWLPIPRDPLPFPSIVAVSSNDPLARQSRVEELARDWDSQCVYVGAVGHLNPASGFGEWPQAEMLIDLLDRRA